MRERECVKQSEEKEKRKEKEGNSRRLVGVFFRENVSVGKINAL